MNDSPLPFFALARETFCGKTNADGQGELLSALALYYSK